MSRIPASDRRAALLQAAFRVIAAEGVTGATTRAIVAEADMSLASFHYAFTSRDEMMRELISHVIENQAIAAFESLRYGSDIRTAVRDGLQAFFDVVLADPGHEQVMFELMQYSLRTPELAGLPREQYAGYRLAVSGLLETAAADTGVTWLLPLDDVARMVVAITDGITLGWLADRDTAAANRVIEFAATSIASLTAPLGANLHALTTIASTTIASTPTVPTTTMPINGAPTTTMPTNGAPTSGTPSRLTTVRTP